MTQWVEEPTGGRERGLRALARAWIEVLVRPRRFFRVAVAPGDQAPGLVFAMTVVFAASILRLALTGETPFGTAYPILGGRPVGSIVLVLGVIVVLVTPLFLHLVAALLTALLIPFADDRAGVGETVQVLGYATAPCVVVGLPVPAAEAVAACVTVAGIPCLVPGIPLPSIQVAAAGYGAVLLSIGVSEVHRVSLARAAALSALPAAIAFGYGFRGFEAAAALLDAWGLI